VKKVLTAVLCLLVPGLLVLNTWQAWRYNALADEISALEKEQKSLLEANRDTIARIAYETSPERVAEKAAALGLVPAAPPAVTRLQAGTVTDGGPAR
jgi:hypothetical protein